jgi:hypothetical protein
MYRLLATARISISTIGWRETCLHHEWRRSSRATTGRPMKPLSKQPQAYPPRVCPAIPFIGRSPRGLKSRSTKKQKLPCRIKYLLERLEHSGEACGIGQAFHARVLPSQAKEGSYDDRQPAPGHHAPPVPEKFQSDIALSRVSTVGDWTASLTKLTVTAVRKVDTDRERAKAAIAKASSQTSRSNSAASRHEHRRDLHLEAGRPHPWGQ